MSIYLPAPDEFVAAPNPTAGARVSGVGSWPNVGAREAIRTVRDVLVQPGGVPYLPEVPQRGPGADMLGRGTGLLVELPTQLTPNGWRIASGRGRELRRAEAYWREDLEQLAEAFEGYSGQLKTQIIGPWTMCATLELPRGEKVLSDLGAVRDVVQSLRAGLSDHVAALRRAVPGAQVIVQLDEPALPGVLNGQVPSASGLRRLRAIDAGLVQDTLRNEVDALRAQSVETVLHSCAPGVPVSLLAKTGAAGLALDTSLLTAQQFDALGSALDAGAQLWAGAVWTSGPVPSRDQVIAQLRKLLSHIGFGAEILGSLVITPACGLAMTTPADALARQKLCIDVMDQLNDES